MKQYFKKSILIAIIINGALSVQLHAASPTKPWQSRKPDSQARKRAERLMGHVQPDTGVKREEAEGDISAKKAQKRLDRLKKQIQPSKPESALAPEDVGATSKFIEKPEHCDVVIKKWKNELRKYGRVVVEQMLENEERYQDTHIVFYHAQQQGNRIIVETLKNLYERENKKPLRSDFEFLRLWTEGSDYKDVNSYLDSFGIPNPFTVGPNNMNDNDPKIRAMLLAVNPVLFGNFDWEGECTFAYFLSDRSIKMFVQSALRDIFQKYGLNKSFIKDLLDINQKNKSNTGDIVQVFIPKELVDDCAYLCQAWGAPQKNYLLDKNGQPIIKDDKGITLYDNRRERYTKCRTILELLQVDKDAVEDVKKIQLRLFFSKTGPLLNPDLGAKIFRFTTLSVEQLREYKESVKDVLRKAFAHYEKPLLRRIKEGLLGTKEQASPRRAEEQSNLLTSQEKNEAQPRPLTFQEKNIIEKTVDRLVIPINIFEAITMLDAVEEVKKLLAQGVDINQVNAEGETPFFYAVKKGRFHVAHMLLEAGANKEARDKYDHTILMSAVSWANIETIKYLVLDAKVDINAGDKDGKTALMVAARDGMAGFVRLFLENGADIEARDHSGQTVLMEAAQWGRLNVVKILMQAGMDKEARDKDGRTVLLYSVGSAGKVDVVQFLLQAGANKQVRDTYGRTALMFAVAGENIDIVKFLLQTGVDIEAKDIADETALMHAVAYGSLEVIKILVDAGANIDAKNQGNKTALDIAIWRHKKEVATYLQDVKQQREKIKSKL
ncbi:MAG TPA: ankyrin repeat domain-containing protein [Candidatus Babeliales bacterium]|nr:ankyrin repeat domain-containing protein [Candidatus Babeliales bacterium]